MAHLSRLIWFALGVMLAAVPMLAFADEYPPVKEYQWQTTGKYYVLQEACDAAITSYTGPFGPLTPGICEETSSSSWRVKFTQTNGSTGAYGGVIGLVCPGGGTLQSVLGVPTCVNAPPCEEGEQRDATGVCKPPPCEPPNFVDQFGECREPCPEAGTADGRGHVYQGGNTCLQSCERKATKCALKMNIEGPQDDRPYVCDYVFTGSSCDWIGEKITDAPPVPEPEPEPEPCGAGKVSGTYNGQTLCLNEGETTLRDDTKKETTETQRDDGTKEVKETTTDTRSQFDPKTGKTKTTITETTTTTTEDANGNTLGTKTEIVIRQRESAGNNVDREAGGGDGDGGEGEGGGTFAGACGIAPLCEGDAVQCAIAAAVFETQCALAYEQQALNEQWTAIETYDGTEEGGALEKKDLSEGLSEMLATSKQGPGSGLSDKSYTVFGKTVVLPFSLINQYLNVFYWAMQSIAWLVAVKILRGAVQ